MSDPSSRLPLPQAVVCNTGPIIALDRAGQLDLILRLIPTVHIPSIVEQEITHSLISDDDSLRVWLRDVIIQEPQFPVDALLIAELDAGEASVISLASEFQCGVLMDERKGRRVASVVYGLQVIGTGRILVEAKERGFVTEIRPLMEQMRAGGYYLSDRLVDALCREVGE